MMKKLQPCYCWVLAVSSNERIFGNMPNARLKDGPEEPVENYSSNPSLNVSFPFAPKRSL
jgi:hypothetical protein